jgi:UDP-N-acetyl-D-glucosamine dehydrogenase
MIRVKITVIGLGYVGLPIAVYSANAGFEARGFDIDEKKINDLKAGISDSPEVSTDQLISLQARGNLFFSSDIYEHKESSIYVIAVPTPLDSQHKPDLEYVKKACAFLAKIVKSGDLIINESTSYIGTLRNLIKPLIDDLSGINDLKYAVAPERIDPGNRVWNLTNTPRNLAGLTNDATKLAAEFYGSFCDSVNIVSKPEVAEAAKLFENTFRHVNIALVNEFSEIANKYDFSASETIIAAANKPFGFMPFFPSVGVGGHCIPVDPSYLAFSAEQVGLEANFINLANQVNFSTPRKLANRIRIELGGDLSGKRIQLVGITYKPNVSDLRESPALELIKELKSLGAQVFWLDPYIEIYDGEKSQALDPNIDLGLIIIPHDGVDLTIWKESNTKVLDLSANSRNFGWPKFL